MEFQQGYPERYHDRFQELHDGKETKRSVAYAGYLEPGDTHIGASKERPIIGLDFASQVTVENTPDVETAVGSYEYLNDRLFQQIQASDGDDVLLNLGLNSESAVQDTFFREASSEQFEDIAQTEDDTLRDHCILPLYSEVPISLKLILRDIAAEYTGGTITLANGMVVISAIYGDGRLGFEQPIIEQHNEEIGDGRNALEDITRRKPFYGVIFNYDSTSKAAAEQAGDGIRIGRFSTMFEMKDNHNEVIFNMGAMDALRYCRLFLGEISAAVGEDRRVISYEMFGDELGHINNDTAEVAVTQLEDQGTTLGYVAVFSPNPGDTAKKAAAAARMIASAKL